MLNLKLQIQGITHFSLALLFLFFEVLLCSICYNSCMLVSFIGVYILTALSKLNICYNDNRIRHTWTSSNCFAGVIILQQQSIWISPTDPVPVLWKLLETCKWTKRKHLRMEALIMRYTENACSYLNLACHSYQFRGNVNVPNHSMPCILLMLWTYVWLDPCTWRLSKLRLINLSPSLI